MLSIWEGTIQNAFFFSSASKIFNLKIIWEGVCRVWAILFENIVIYTSLTIQWCARNYKVRQFPVKVRCIWHLRKVIYLLKKYHFRFFYKWPSSNYFTWYMLFRVFLWHDLLQLKKPSCRGTYHHNCHVFIFARDFKSHRKVHPRIPPWLMSYTVHYSSDFLSKINQSISFTRSWAVMTSPPSLVLF